MTGIEAHLVGKLGKDAETRTTKTGKPMAVLQVVVSDSGADDATWCTVLAFENLADQLAGLPKGAEVYAKGRLRVAVYHPECGEPRASLTLLAHQATPMVLERTKPRKRQATVYGADAPRQRSYARPARGGADFDDPL